jgi:hypothetical protein
MDVLLTSVTVLCRAVLAVRRVLLLKPLAAVLLDRQGLLHLGLLLLMAMAAARAAAVLLADCRTAVSVAVLLACNVMQDQRLLDMHKDCVVEVTCPYLGLFHCLSCHARLQQQ